MLNQEQQELQELRNKRLQQLKSSSSQPSNQQQKQAQIEQQKQQQQQAILYQILTNEARERLNRIKIVKQDKAAAVEELLLNIYRQGQVRDKITEQQLIDLLSQISSQSSNASKITYSRKSTEDWD